MSKDLAQNCFDKIAKVMTEFTVNSTKDDLILVEEWLLKKAIGCMMASQINRLSGKHDSAKMSDAIEGCEERINEIAQTALEEFFKCLELVGTKH